IEAEKMAAPVVHLELHTGNLPRAFAFYTELFGWRAERLELESGSYDALRIGGGIDGGGVECATRQELWLPYVEMENVAESTDRARSLGASVLLPPHEGPAGWRSVLAAPSGSEIALWQP